MKTLSISTLLVLLLLVFSTSADKQTNFLRCLHHHSDYNSISNVVYTPANSSFTSVLDFSIRNLRFESESTPKPQVIITPVRESQIPPLIICAKKTGLEIRTRSGGHDMEGLSYVSQNPFIIVDLINLSEVKVNVKAKTAWVGAGATTGIVYYRIGEKSPNLGFTGAICLTAGVGGHYSGGGYGTLMRKYGLAGDNVIDARIITAKGKILDRKSMGEDLFWAIRGGGAASFGVVVAWKIRLVDVPETVTIFSALRNLDQNMTQLVHRWQYVAPKLDRDLFLGIYFYRAGDTLQANFFSVYLGGVDALMALMEESFPELGLAREECNEVSWVQGTLLSATTPLENLLNRTQAGLRQLKAKSDYVRTPVPLSAFEDIVTMMFEPDAGETLMYLVPYGGRMDDISESSTPFPHRNGTLYKLSALVYWPDAQAGNADNFISWSRKYYDYMAPYVSSSPREAYLNYRDLDIGVNNVVGETSYEQASVWGRKYFKDNFDRLVRVKSAVDPDNFFKNEQSFPPSYARTKSSL